VDTLNVWDEKLPEFDQEAIGAKYKGINKEPMDEAEQDAACSVDLHAGRHLRPKTCRHLYRVSTIRRAT
jgi:hypothetical protein